jgi:hypothetical protein
MRTLMMNLMGTAYNNPFAWTNGCSRYCDNGHLDSGMREWDDDWLTEKFTGLIYRK